MPETSTAVISGIPGKYLLNQWVCRKHTTECLCPIFSKKNKNVLNLCI